jgi:hypothetical protein
MTHRTRSGAAPILTRPSDTHEAIGITRPPRVAARHWAGEVEVPVGKTAMSLILHLMPATAPKPLVIPVVMSTRVEHAIRGQSSRVASLRPDWRRAHSAHPNPSLARYVSRISSL